MTLGVQRRAVGVFTHRRDAEKALYELRDSGLGMDRVSVVVRDADKDNIAGVEVRSKNVGNKADEGATVGALSGGALGGLTGLLVGLGALAIPGVGPIMLAGATATALATTLAGAGIGAAAGTLLGGLIGLGIPEERAKVYNERVERGDYLVIVDGTDTELQRAEAILHRSGIEEYGVYNYPNSQAAPVPVTHQTIGTTKHAVGYFSNLRDAQAAIRDLQAAGFPLSRITLLRKDSSPRHELPTTITVSDRIDTARLRIPSDRARFYNEIVNRGEYVIIIDGTDEELRHAGSIFHRYGIQHWQIFDPSEIHTSPDYAVAPTTNTNYIAEKDSDDPVVIIIDRREESV